MTYLLPANKILESKLKAFECKKCGNCCRGPGVVRVTGVDASRIAQFLGVDIDEFYKEYTVCLLGGHFLKDKENQECIFLQESLCRIHEVKPEQCASFPQKWRNPDIVSYCAGLKD